VTSPRDRLDSEQPSRSTTVQTDIPPIFILGVVLMAVVVGGLLLRSALATPRAAAATANPSPAPGRTATQATPTPDPTPYLNLRGYVWPLIGATVTLPFGPSDWGEFIVDGKHFHDGVDMATKCGDNVMAAHDGVVLAASRKYDDYMGWTSSLAPYYNLLDTKHWWESLPIVVVIDDGDGYRSIYAHEYQVTVTPGQHVKAGQVIGYEGATGNASGCHVHFGLFSPTEKATFQLDPNVVAKDLMPSAEIARINPLLVLPFHCEIEEMRTLRPEEGAPCPVLATPSPTPKATPTLSD
jgi:murein DD-endopeptidase MepM/ murein hydrolase activator NlpD